MLNMEVLLDLIAGVAAVLLALALARRTRAVIARGARESFHAVSVRDRTNSCPLAQALEGTRFLSREAPVLPLASCRNPECSCVYEHFDDRRDRDRRDARMSQFYTPGQVGRSAERRRLRGRRQEDKA